jgi:dihydropyrimidinase
MSAILIEHGTVVTAAETFAADIYVEDERIVWIGRRPPELLPHGVIEIDATGKYVMPGGIDAHTHLDMPLGAIRSVDDFESGAVAAAWGGTTTIIDYAAHAHGERLAHGLDAWQRKAEGKAVIDYGFHMTLSEFTADTLADMPAMTDAGVTSFKVFTAYPDRLMIDDGAIFQVLQQAREIGGLVCVHAENGHVIDVLVRQALAQGRTAPKYHARTRPPEAEAEAAHRVITLAALAGAPLYIVHISCADTLRHILDAKQRGQPVYAETCPQYLTLSDACYDLPLLEGAKYVMSPPLRPKAHQEALWQGIRNGLFDTVGTDHCPFSFREHKTRGTQNFTDIPNGAPGIETRLALLFTTGVETGRISLNRFVDLVATAPAKIFGLYPRKGTLMPGSDADIIIVDPQRETVVSAVTHHSHADYTLYEGMRLKGMPEVVIVRGRILMQNGKFFGKPGDGRFLKRKGHCSVAFSR